MLRMTHSTESFQMYKILLQILLHMKRNISTKLDPNIKHQTQKDEVFHK